MHARVLAGPITLFEFRWIPVKKKEEDKEKERGEKKGTAERSWFTHTSSSRSSRCQGHSWPQHYTSPTCQVPTCASAAGCCCCFLSSLLYLPAGATLLLTVACVSHFSPLLRFGYYRHAISPLWNSLGRSTALQLPPLTSRPHVDCIPLNFFLYIARVPYFAPLFFPFFLYFFLL